MRRVLHILQSGVILGGLAALPAVAQTPDTPRTDIPETAREMEHEATDNDFNLGWLGLLGLLGLAGLRRGRTDDRYDTTTRTTSTTPTTGRL
jgi:MYXO-CTERM domain-containing protein